MSRILSDKERSILLKAYKDDRMKEAPANISDKTLIENYGTNEQKKLLSGFTPTEPAPKGTENKARENKGANPEPPANGGNTGSGYGAGADKGSEEEDKIKAEKELEYQKSEYFRLYGENPNEAFTVDEIRAANLTKEKENTAKTEDATAYLDAFNEYVRLHDGKTPNSELTTEQLKEANSKKVEELKNTPKVQDITQVPEGASVTPEKKDGTVFFKGQEMIKLRNVKTGETRLYPKQTYLRFMLGRVYENQWIPYEEPDEVKNL